MEGPKTAHEEMVMMRKLYQEIVLKQYYHIGVAVDTDAGLIVPVIRDADKKDLLQLSRELEDLARKARERKVSGEELKGGKLTEAVKKGWNVVTNKATDD